MLCRRKRDDAGLSSETHRNGERGTWRRLAPCSEPALLSGRCRSPDAISRRVYIINMYSSPKTRNFRRFGRAATTAGSYRCPRCVTPVLWSTPTTSRVLKFHRFGSRAASFPFSRCAARAVGAVATSVTLKHSSAGRRKTACTPCRFSPSTTRRAPAPGRTPTPTAPSPSLPFIQTILTHAPGVAARLSNATPKRGTVSTLRMLWTMRARSDSKSPSSATSLPKSAPARSEAMLSRNMSRHKRTGWSPTWNSVPCVTRSTRLIFASGHTPRNSQRNKRRASTKKKSSGVSCSSCCTPN